MDACSDQHIVLAASVLKEMCPVIAPMQRGCIDFQSEPACAVLRVHLYCRTTIGATRQIFGSARCSEFRNRNKGTTSVNLRIARASTLRLKVNQPPLFEHKGKAEALDT